MASRLTELCAKLAEPFPPEELEWRLAQAGMKGDKIWARALTYITSRALMDRFDNVFGPGNWQSTMQVVDGATLCGIGVKDPESDEWIWKWDGTGELAKSDGLSESDAKKGDFSNAFKRCAVQWGAARYLYWIEDSFVTVFTGKQGQYRGTAKDPNDSKKKLFFTWDPPELPDWALPGGSGRPHKTAKPGRDPYTKDMFEDQEKPTKKAKAEAPAEETDEEQDKLEATPVQHKRLAQLAALMQTNGFGKELAGFRKKLSKKYNKRTAGVAIREMKAFLADNEIEWSEEQAEGN